MTTSSRMGAIAGGLAAGFIIKARAAAVLEQF
jgi:hypothetical protein